MADYSRGQKKSKLQALQELKRVRDGGKRTFKEDSTKLYDEVSEEQYKKIVKGRLQRDDFVEDDGVEGYMDNGMDDWGADDDEEYESEEEETRRKKKAKKKTKGETAKSKTKAPPPAVAPSINAYRPIISAEKEEDLMAGILGDMDAEPVAAPVARSRKRKPSPRRRDEYSSSPVRSGYRSRSSNGDPSSDGPYDDFPSLPPSDDTYFSPKKKPRTGGGDTTPAIDRLALSGASSDAEMPDAGFDDIDMDSFMADDDELLDVKPVVAKAAPSKVLPKKEEKAEAPPGLSWLSVVDTLNVVSEKDSLGPLASSSNPSHASKIDALEPDGSLIFFWLDYLEHEGRLYFTGKLKDRSTGVWVSCCITVLNLQRHLFVLPRKFRADFAASESTKNPVLTDELVEKSEVYADFDQLRRKAGVKAFKGKFVQKKYAFGDPEVPDEGEWLEVVYPFEEPQIPMEATSPNIAKIFGTNTSAFELLVLQQKIMGPCWLRIKNPTVEFQGVSWCKFEATVSAPEDINPVPDAEIASNPEFAHMKDQAAPPMTVMSLSLRTIVNHQENIQEVVSACARVWKDIILDDTKTPDQLPCTVQTLIRPLDRFPTNFERDATKRKEGILPMRNERMLLNSLLVTLHRVDPDFIVGHDFLGVSLDVLLHRMKELKVEHWSRLGRFRRSKWPNIGRQGSNIRFLNGRLLADLTSDGAKGMISSTTWSLTEMCRTHLKINRLDIDPDDVAGYLDGSLSAPDKMMEFVLQCAMDSHLQMAIASKVQMLALTKQLTNLAGNSWNRTLNGGRAERNEYILLHEFHELGYVCPDKNLTWATKKKEAAVKSDPQEGGEPQAAKDAKAKKAKRDKYKGGLVFDPKRGLWDKYILVMDFNSLYPSIIQEYNIDFTTIKVVEDPKEAQEDGEDVQPEPPSDDVPQGVLPRLIATLVNRRREVKKYMKNKSETPAKLLQYDIKQQALKLTANSMYGCLGFEHSRFYARPLASLTTFKGREILTQTRDLAESLGLDVVYGDTDSVFVNSNVTELSEALRISREFKIAVNKRYKLLEIDLDGIFQRLLLLQKKKYAAIKVEDGDGERTSVEVKGLDMKRREYCALSKEVSGYVLDQILSGEATETVVERIHEYLAALGESVKSGSRKIDDYIIFKRLGKNPEDYPRIDGQPHVKVALRIKAKGGSAKAGDVIPYLFCLPEGETTAKAAQSDRAFHPDEFRKDNLKLDYEFYLSQQILPPIERLCDPIEGTDRARLAECLGLDPARFRSSNAGSADDGNAFTTLESQLSDAQRYKDAVPLVVRCSNCKVQSRYAPLQDRTASFVQNTGPTCPNSSCGKAFNIYSLQAQLEVQIREQISKFYESWTVCDDPTCGQRTRMMGVFGRRCLRKDCQGQVTLEYSDAKLYTQLKYFSYLFNGERAIKAATGDQLEAITVLAKTNSQFLETMGACVEKYLDQCGRRWVEMGTIFSFMKI